MSSFPYAKSFSSSSEKDPLCWKTFSLSKTAAAWGAGCYSAPAKFYIMMHCKLRACQLCALKLGLPNPVLSPAGDLGEHRFGSSNPDLMNRGVWEMSPEIPVFQKYPG